MATPVKKSEPAVVSPPIKKSESTTSIAPPTPTQNGPLTIDKDTLGTHISHYPLIP